MDELHIFGASGAVGTFLLARLRAEPQPAIALTQKTPCNEASEGPIHWRQLDLWRDRAASNATTIISAGPLDGLAAWLARVDTNKLARIVALSSMSIEAKRDAIDPVERALAGHLQQSERLLRETCVARCIGLTLLRPTLIWGAARDRSLTPLYRFGQRYGFVPVPNSTGGLRQPIHVADVAEACLTALRCPESMGAIFNVGGGERLPVSEMWLRVARVAKARGVRVPHWLLRATSSTLRPTLERWHNTQIADQVNEITLPNWQPRGFHPTRDDFTGAL